MKHLIILFFFLCLSTGLKTQVVSNTVFDSYKGKTIYLDSLPIEDVYRLAGNYIMWDKFSVSETIYDYILSKQLFATQEEDTLPVGSYFTYIDLAYLRMRKHRYTEAYRFLRLSDKAKQPQFWCGNAMMDVITQKEAYDLECKFALATGREKALLWNELLNTAFADNSYGTPDYAGQGLINFLRSRYSEAQIDAQFNQAIHKIHTRKKKKTDYFNIENKVMLFNTRVYFSFYCDDCAGNDPQALRKSVSSYYKYKIERWKRGY